jgi:hypothetical protein
MCDHHGAKGGNQHTHSPTDRQKLERRRRSEERSVVVFQCISTNLNCILVRDERWEVCTLGNPSVYIADVEVCIIIKK